jgi:alpha-1,6-mannosyltransferase
VPLGVDLRLFAPWKRDDLWKENFDSMPLLLLCSRLSREKNPRRAIDVARELRRRGLKAHLVIIGDGPLRGELERAAAGLPVTFLGFIADRAVVARIMASVDILLAPGPIETFGLAALESLACGTPVVAAKSGAIGEILGGAGLCAGDSEVQWSDAVQQILSRKEGARRAAARARAEEFNWSTTVGRLVDIYKIPLEVEDVA